MTLSSALLQLAGRHHRHAKTQDGSSFTMWGIRSKLASRNEGAQQQQQQQQQRPPCRARTTHTATEDAASEDDRNASDHSDHELEHSMAAIRSTSAALEVARRLAHLHEHPQPAHLPAHRSGSETESVGSNASGEAQDHATRSASLVQQLLEYAQSCPEVLAKRCHSTHATLWLRAAEAGQVGLLRAFVGIVQENASAVRSAVLRRYMLRIGAPDLSDVKVLLLKLLNGATAAGMTPLHVAAIRGHADVVQFLLEQGADAWRTDPVCFRTPLHYACIAGKADVVAVLLQAMGNEHDAHGTRYIEATTETGMSPLLYAAALGYPEVVRLLLRAGADWLASKLNDMPDPHVQASCMSNALHLAATIGNTEIALDLLQAYMLRLDAHPRGTPGAPRDPRRVCNIFNAMPHHMASASQHTEVARLLHPSRHLHELFGLQQLAGTGVEAPAAVPSLAVLAAAALQAKLLADLETLKAAASAAVADDAGDAAADAGSASSSAACLLPAAAGVDAAAAEGGATAAVDDEDEDDDAAGLCDVCMDCRSDCLIEACRHRMCASCAGNLCSRMRSTPMRCPFCRGAIAAFAPLPGNRRATKA